MSKWKKVGRVWVDAGYLIVGDPFTIPSGESGQEMLNRLEALDNECGEYSPGIVAVKTGLGDGTYEVEVREEEVPGWGTRTVEMRIIFIEDLDKAAAFADAVAGKKGR